MEPSPGLALACVVVISDLGVHQEREIELELGGRARLPARAARLRARAVHRPAQRAAKACPRGAKERPRSSRMPPRRPANTRRPPTPAQGQPPRPGCSNARILHAGLGRISARIIMARAAGGWALRAARWCRVPPHQNQNPARRGGPNPNRSPPHRPRSRDPREGRC